MNWQKCNVCGETWWPEQEGEPCPYCIYGNKPPAVVPSVEQITLALRRSGLRGPVVHSQIVVRPPLSPGFVIVLGLVRPKAALKVTARKGFGVDLHPIPL